MAKMTTSSSSAPTTTASAVSKASMSRNRGWLAASLRPSPTPATTSGAPRSAGASAGTRSPATSNPARQGTPATGIGEDQHGGPHRVLGEDEHHIRRQHAQQRPVARQRAESA